MICPECNEEMDVLGRGFDPVTRFAWSEWQCFKCGAVVLHTEEEYTADVDSITEE